MLLLAALLLLSPTAAAAKKEEDEGGYYCYGDGHLHTVWRVLIFDLHSVTYLRILRQMRENDSR